MTRRIRDWLGRSHILFEAHGSSAADSSSWKAELTADGATILIIVIALTVVTILPSLIQLLS